LNKYRSVVYSALLIFFVLSVFHPLYAIQTPDQVAAKLVEKGLPPILITGFISLLPIFELRGAIPVGLALFKQNPIIVYIIAVIFNLLPILPILYLLFPIRKFLVDRGILNRFFNYLDKRAEKNSKIVERYGEFGLALFVAIPLPITGAWTGSLIAVFMGLPPIKSFLYISLGVFSAGVIVTLITIIGMKALILVIPVIVGLILLVIVKYIMEKKGVNNVKRGGDS